MEAEEQGEPVASSTESPKPMEADETSSANTKAASPRSAANSPEPNCAICLGKPENKSFTDSCFHQFCFTCLLEWSKIKAQCPLCKQPFNSIVHNVRSDMDYDQYHLRPSSPFRGSRLLDMVTSDMRFRYRTTLTADRQAYRAEQRRRHEEPPHSASTCPFMPRRYRQPYPVMTSQFRSHIYTHKLWARASTSSRLRDTSSVFFRANPACTHRLVPWLNRELCALMFNQESNVAFVLELIMSLIIRYDILSPEFREHMRPYLMDNTTHFIHEFYHFARSPFDMISYDGRVEYSELVPTAETTAFQYDSDSDVMVLSPEPRLREVEVIDIPEDDVSPPHSDLLETHNPEPPSRTTTSNSLENPTLIQVKRFLEQATTLPEPDMNTSVTDLADWVIPMRNRPQTGNMTPEAGPSGLSRFAATPPLLTRSHIVYDTSDSDEDFRMRLTQAPVTSYPDPDDIEVVGYVKPIRERTPVVVNVTSGSEPEFQETPRSKNKKKGKQVRKLQKSDTSDPDYIPNYREKRKHISSDDSDSDSDVCYKRRLASVVGLAKLKSTAATTEPGASTSTGSQQCNTSFEGGQKSTHKHKKHKKHKHKHRKVTEHRKSGRHSRKHKDKSHKK